MFACYVILSLNLVIGVDFNVFLDVRALLERRLKVVHDTAGTFACIIVFAFDGCGISSKAGYLCATARRYDNIALNILHLLDTSDIV